MGPFPARSLAGRQPLPAPPELSADESVQQSQAEHWQEEINGGDPGHCLEQPRAGHALNGPALPALLGQAAVGVFHPEEEEDGAGGQEGAAPQRQDDPFHPALGDGRFGFQGKADGEVPLHAHRGDVQDGAVRACFAQVNEELAEKIPKYVGLVLPKAVEVRRQAKENQRVRQRHAGQVHVHCRPHLLRASENDYRYQIPRDSQEKQDDGNYSHGHQNMDVKQRKRLIFRGVRVISEIAVIRDGAHVGFQNRGQGWLRPPLRQKPESR